MICGNCLLVPYPALSGLRQLYLQTSQAPFNIQPKYCCCGEDSEVSAPPKAPHLHSLVQSVLYGFGTETVEGWVTQRGKRPPQPAKKVALTPPFLSHSRKISRVALTDNRSLTGNPETWADRPTVGFNTPVISKKVWAQTSLSCDHHASWNTIGPALRALPRDQKPKTVSCFRYCHLCKSSLHLSPAEALTYQLSGEDDKKTGTTLEVLPAIRSLPPALQEHSDVPKTPRQHKDTVTQHTVGPIPWTQGDSDRPTFYLLKK
ncbi:hypothetical protein MJT46_015538 [Ovis ammon polii x Ovis aries]|nr:hypothetical protein MJT46_015538 [Ovis ammon polii x Ovis aries]